ncbi:hypothetical protein BX600DRAFT_440292 [Xylariales sp. PMI_506]|nr:hypothetical protein BX600DRAFT_440292 [Xylariales sp. PMI_506]
MSMILQLQQWAVPRLQKLLPLDGRELERIVTYVSGLGALEASKYLKGLLNETTQSQELVSSFLARRAELRAENGTPDLASGHQQQRSHPLGPQNVRQDSDGNAHAAASSAGPAASTSAAAGSGLKGRTVSSGLAGFGAASITPQDHTTVNDGKAKACTGTCGAACKKKKYENLTW